MEAAAYELNHHKSEWCVLQILDAIQSFHNKKGRKPVVALLGLALHPRDCEDSPASQIVLNVFRESHKACVLIADPLLIEHSFFQLTDFCRAYDLADIAVFFVRHPVLKLLSSDMSKVVLDFCGVRCS